MAKRRAKSDRQNFRIENAIDVANRFRRFAHALAAHAHTFAHELDQAQLQFLMRLPKLRVGNVDDAAPEIRLGEMFFPIAEMLAIERGKLRRHPGFGVHAVGDAGDRHFVHGHARPNIFPKRSAHFAVQFAHAVSVPAQAQRQDRHAEGIRRIDARLSEAKQFFERNLQFARKIRRNISASSSRENESLPAGTGVCVVKTLAAATTCSAE